MCGLTCVVDSTCGLCGLGVTKVPSVMYEAGKVQYLVSGTLGGGWP